MKERRASLITTMADTINRRMSFIKLDNTITKSLDYWSRHNPLLMADEVFLETRGAWKSKTDFIISSVSYGIGLGNMWRFPYYCLKFGCGSFLLVYTLCVIAIAIPLSLLETVLAQFAGAGVTQCWRFSPGFKGIGYSMLLVSFFCSCYYTLVLAWSLFYLLNSVRLEIPFLNCQNFWNDAKCIALTGRVVATNESMTQSAAEQFWYRYVTTQFTNDGKFVNTIDKNPDNLVWYTTSCLIIAWCITAYILTKGIRVTTEKIFISVIWPYSVLIVFIVLSAHLPGSKDGFLLLIRPTLDGLLTLSTWFAAGEQVFYSFGVGFGGIVTMGSYNRFHYNIQRDTIIICVINYVTSCLSAVVSFLILGHVSYRYSRSMDNIITNADLGLVFMIFPECCAYYSHPQITNAMFFVTLFILGFDSILVMMETVVTGLIDIVPVLNETRYHRICFVVVLHIGCIVFSLIFVTKTGYNWFIIFTKYTASVNIMVIGLIETAVVAYIYKLNNFYRDCKMMVPSSVFPVWKVSFFAIIPMVLITLIIFGFSTKSHTVTGTGDTAQTFPIWADVIGWIILILTIIPIPGFYICYIIYVRLSNLLTFKQAVYQSISPDIKWGPSKKRKWLLNDFYKDRLFVIKEMAEEMKKNPESGTRKQWYHRLNLLSDSVLPVVEFDESQSKESDDNMSVLPFEINFEALKRNDD